MKSWPFSSLFSHKAKTGGILLSLLLVLMIVLSACGAGTGSTKAGSNALTVVPSPVGDFTRNFNPFSPGAAYGTLGTMYETLLFFNSMDGSVKPWLASSYQFSSDATSVTFHLRQNVKWSDGKPFTSSDVAFTLNMLKQYPALDTNALWQTLKSVQASDAQTVTVTFMKAYTPILWYLAGQTYIVPEHIWSSVSNPSNYTNPNPIGTGPFTLKSFTPQLIDLVKNNNYWQPGKPVVQEVRYPSYSSATSTSLVLSQGKLDWAGLYTPNIQQTYVNRDPTHNHYWFPAHNIVMMYLNLTKAPFNQLAVRQAISDAIDRNKLYTVGESGYEPVAHPTGLVLPANSSFLNSQYANSSFAQSVAQANSLLTGAGFTKGSDGIYADKSGNKLSFSLNVVTGWTDWVTDCQIMADNLKQIGMNVTVNALSYNAYVNALETGKFDTAISWTNPGPTPYYLYNSMLNSSNSAPVGKVAPSNWERWINPATDNLLNQYASSADSATQQQALNGLQKIMLEQLPGIPLVYGATWYEYNTSRFTGWPDQNNPYAVPAPWSYPDNEVVLLNIKPVA